MKSVFEKIIERLEEEKSDWNNDYNVPINNAIEIVKQEAEQYQSSEWGLVSKSEVLKVIEDIKCNDDIPKNYGTLLDIMRKIRNMSTVDNNGWIPCSGRLPEESFGCLVTVMDCEPSTQTEFENILPYFVGYDGDGWNDADGEQIPFEVIAWQPLPQPFQKGDNNENS